MPRRLVTPAAAAHRKAWSAPAAAIESTDIPSIDRLHNPAELFPKIDTHHVDTPADIAPAFRVQDQIPPCVDVLVVLKTVLPPHPHELCAAGSDPKLKWFPIGLKLHRRILHDGLNVS